MPGQEREIRFATNRKPRQAGAFGIECEDPRARLRLGRAIAAEGASPLLDATLRDGTVSIEVSDSTAADRIAWLGDWLLGAAAAGEVPLLTIHGFCYSFADAVARAGQIAAFYATGDFAVRLAPLAFCWPSRALLGNDHYLADRTQCEGSDEALAALLREIGAAAAATGVRPMLLAHSMGVYMTRLGVGALAAGGGLPAAPAFAQAVLVAGDDDRTVMDEGGPLRPLAALASFVTIGVFRDDGVIKVNEELLGRSPRLGLHGPLRPGSLPPNVAVVDYGYAVDPLQSLPLEAWRDTGLNAIGHQYYRNGARVRDDLAQVFGDVPPTAVRGRRRGEEMIDPTVAINPIAGRLYPVGETVAP